MLSDLSFHIVGSSAQPDIQQLMDKYQLTTSQVSREIQPNNVPYLAVLFDNVELYVDAMELTPSEQMNVLRQDVTTCIKMIECLMIWKKKKLSQATFSALLEMLVKLKKEAIADQICQYLSVSLYLCLGVHVQTRYIYRCMFVCLAV